MLSQSHEFIHTSVLWRPSFLAVLHPHWLFHLSPSSSTEFPEPWGEGSDADIPFRTVLRSLTLCILSGCGSLYLFPSTAKGSLWWRQNKILIYAYSKMSLGDFMTAFLYQDSSICVFPWIPGLSSFRFLTWAVSSMGSLIPSWDLNSGWLLPQLLCPYCANASYRKIVDCGLVGNFLLCWCTAFFQYPEY